MTEVAMPQLGETVTEGTITRWFKQVGEQVAENEVLFEVSTDKVDTEVPSPASGTLSEIKVAEGETVDVGTVLAVVGDGAAAPAPATPAEESAPPPPAAEAPPAPAPAPAPMPDPIPSAPSRPSAEGLVLSPVVRRLIHEYNIDPGKVSGTGQGGRISRDDVQRYIESNHLQPGSAGAAVAPPPAAAAAAPPAPAPAPAPAPPAPAPAAVQAVAPVPVPVVHAAPAIQVGSSDTVVPLSTIRRRTGEHMVMSKAVSPHTLTAIEIDYENVEVVRKAARANFKADEGFSLTYLPFISRATIDALREYPHLNASVGENELVVHGRVNLAVAVDLDFQGLLAPVVKDAEGKRMRALARDIVDVATRARSKQLTPDDLSGGTFTLTNAGSYGTMMQFPIINQPQVAILSTDGIHRKPVVITDDFGNESIAIHSVGVLALAWDHRAIDGAYAAAFLARIKEIIETRDWTTELA